MAQQGSPTSISAPRGPFQYYEPPKRSDPKRRSYAERSSEYGDVVNDSLSNPLGITAGLDEPFHSDPEVASESPTNPQQLSSRMDTDTPPPNLRSKPWSPGIPSPPQSQQTPAHVNPANGPRRGSVPEKSPLQKLEADLVSKEQKRAKLVSAEDRVRQRNNSASEHRRTDSTRSNKSQTKIGSDQIAAVAPDVNGGAQRDSSFYDVPSNNRKGELRDVDGKPKLESGPRRSRTSSTRQRPSTIIANDSQPGDRGSYAFNESFSAREPASPTITLGSDAAARGKAAHERRKRQSQVDSSSLASGTIRAERMNDGPVAVSSTAELGDSRSTQQQRQRQLRVSTSQTPTTTHPISKQQVATDKTTPISYTAPPQVASAQQAREQIGFDGVQTSSQPGNRHHLGAIFHKHETERRVYQSQDPNPEEWRTGGIARLTTDDLNVKTSKSSKAEPAEQELTWWEKREQRPSTTTKAPTISSAQLDAPYEEKSKQYRPQLFSKCGPLLRYTGIRKESSTNTQGDVEVWHGSILMVTEDRQSDYSSSPTLRIFAQNMDLCTPTSQHGVDGSKRAAPETQDPVAGQVKLSRTGRPLYVRPVHDIASEVDLSREENPRGLFAATRTPILGPQTVPGSDGRQSQHITVQDRVRVKKHSGERTGQYREVKGCRLHAERGWTFWRFNIEVELGDQQARIAYRINKGPAIGFWVPAEGQTMNIMFHSCNGFSLSVDSNDFSGPDPLWRDVLNRHQVHPFHVMIGGGDQIYNDAVTRDTELFRDWLLIKNREAKHAADFTIELQEELEAFYLERYAMWFSQGLFAMANSQIPMVNIWDDHDIIDGFGSYPHHFMSSPVFTGVGAVAFKYYMLFQHHSVVAETEKEEPSWLLGAGRGPYINQLSRSVFLNLGQNVAFLGLDCRTERMRDEILSLDTYELVFNRCRREMVKGQTRHLIVLLGVPIAYPRLNFLENILTSRAMDPIKALGRTGMLGGFVNKFDGGVEVLDDLDDHWTAKHHKAERNWFIQELQELAAEFSVRITILGGDVHLGAVGQFFTPKKFGIPKDKDHRYMPNVISSAIVNTPPPSMMADVLNKRDKIHHLDHETDENLIPIFLADVDGSARNNKRLLPRRNYCTIREFIPGGTPPPSPRLGREEIEGEDVSKQSNPPRSLGRTMSLTRNPAANLVRRFSSARRSKNPPVSLGRSTSDVAPGVLRRANSLDNPPPSALKSHPPEQFSVIPPERRPSFHRRPTDLSDKQIRKAAARGDIGPHGDGREPGHINLEYGLDISLNMEINQKDPRGQTVPYRILIPALWHEGGADPNTLQLKSRRPNLIQRLASTRKNKRELDEAQHSRSPSPDSFELEPRHDGPNPAVAHTNNHANRTPGVTAQPNTVRNVQQPRGAWRQGYDFTGPPIGARAPEAHAEYDDRAVSPPQELAEFDDDRSLSPQSFISGDDHDPTVNPPHDAGRRQGKANRFFGIEDEHYEDREQDGRTAASHGRHVSVQEEPTTFVYDLPPQRRPSWKIWQR